MSLSGNWTNLSISDGSSTTSQLFSNIRLNFTGLLDTTGTKIGALNYMGEPVPTYSTTYTKPDLFVITSLLTLNNDTARPNEADTGITFLPDDKGGTLIWPTVDAYKGVINPNYTLPMVGGSDNTKLKIFGGNGGITLGGCTSIFNDKNSLVSYEIQFTSLTIDSITYNTEQEIDTYAPYLVGATLTSSTSTGVSAMQYANISSILIILRVSLVVALNISY